MSKKIVYAQEVPNSKTPGNTAIYRMPKFVKELACFPLPEVTTLQQSFLRSAKLFPNDKLAGTQTADRKSYTWKTYAEVKAEADLIGSGIINLDLAPEKNEYENYNLRLIGVYSRNRAEWLTLDISNHLYKGTMVPLYDTLGPDTISFVIGHSNLETIFVEKSAIKTLLKVDNLHNLKTIVSFDKDISSEDKATAEKRNIKMLNWQDILDAGKSKIHEYPKIVPEDCFTFSYTSGTTGNPKGAMLSNKNLMAVITGAESTSINVQKSDVYLSYLPLPHILERLLVCALLFYGASVGFYGGNVLELKQDLALLKPTVFVSVPRLYNKFYAKIKDNMDSAAGCKKCLITKGFTAKTEGLKQGQHTNGMWDGLVFKKTKAVLGGNVTRMIVGSAPISGAVLDFMKITMCCPFIEGYGQTESTGATFCTIGDDPETGHVGGPVCSMEYKLEDVPDMGCTSEDVDKETGKKAPRGEICVRGAEVFLGYYKDRAKTDEAIDKDGWLHTGDVGTILEHNMALKIVDRKKNIFKLSQGEYVSPEKVENMYARAKGVAECFVHGDSLQNYALTIIHPDPVVLQEIAKENGIEGDQATLCKNEKIQKIILKNCNDLGKKEGLKSFEQAKRIHLSAISLAEQNCMTNTMKLQRHNAKIHFKEQIDAMYALGDPAPPAK